MRYARNDAKAYARGAPARHLGGGTDAVHAGSRRSTKRGLRREPTALGRRSRRRRGVRSPASRASSSRCRLPNASAPSRSRSTRSAAPRAVPVLLRSEPRYGVIELARHAQAIGSDYIVVHAPVLHFLGAQDETLQSYYRTISEQVDVGIALWSHPDSGYLHEPGTVRTEWPTCRTWSPSNIVYHAKCTPSSRGLPATG